MIIAAADGSALGNPGPAGWAWYVDDDCWASGGWPHGTNNMGELMAVLDLLQQTAHLDDDLHVFCDSKYVIDSITKWMPGWKRKGWKKGDGKPVMNVELMKALDAAMHGRRDRCSSGSRATPVTGSTRPPTCAPTPPRRRTSAGAVPDPGPGFAGSSTAHPAAAVGQVEAEPDLFSDLDDARAHRRGARRRHGARPPHRRGASGPCRGRRAAAPGLAGGRSLGAAVDPRRRCSTRSARSSPWGGGGVRRPVRRRHDPAAVAGHGGRARRRCGARCGCARARTGSSASTRAPTNAEPPDATCVSMGAPWHTRGMSPAKLSASAALLGGGAVDPPRIPRRWQRPPGRHPPLRRARLPPRWRRPSSAAAWSGAARWACGSWSAWRPDCWRCR